VKIGHSRNTTTASRLEALTRNSSIEAPLLTETELSRLRGILEQDVPNYLSAPAGLSDLQLAPWRRGVDGAMGGEGAADVARAVVKVCDSGKSKLKLLYPDDMPLYDKIRTIAKEIYRAKDICTDTLVRDQLANFEAMSYGNFPICVAKTQYSFPTNPDTKRRADRPCHSRARCATLRRRRVCRRYFRGDHDHTGPAERTGCRYHKHGCRGQDCWIILGSDCIKKHCYRRCVSTRGSTTKIGGN
jgi:hypothetical protein